MIHPTEHLYIVKDDDILDGEPIIKGTTTSVREVVNIKRRGIDSDEIHKHLPHLTQGQIFNALSYFSDHQAEIMDRIIYYRRKALEEKAQKKEQPR